MLKLLRKVLLALEAVVAKEALEGVVAMEAMMAMEALVAVRAPEEAWKAEETPLVLPVQAQG